MCRVRNDLIKKEWILNFTFVKRDPVDLSSFLYSTVLLNLIAFVFCLNLILILLVTPGCSQNGCSTLKNTMCGTSGYFKHCLFELFSPFALC